MVYQAADSSIYISGGHGTHQVKSYINHIDIRRIRAYICHHALDKCFTECCSAVSDGLAGQVCRSCNILVFQRQYHTQR